MSRVSKFDSTCVELIHRRRCQLTVHSYIYYQLNDNLISDHQWQAWADELVILQAKYPEHTDPYDKDFKDWDGSTGFHLCKSVDVHHKAEGLIRYHHEQNN